MACLSQEFLKRLKNPQEQGDKLPLILKREMETMGIDPDLCDFVHKLFLHIVSEQNRKRPTLSAHDLAVQVETGNIKIPNNIDEANENFLDCVDIVNSLNIALKINFKKFSLGMRMNQIAALFILLCNRSLVSFSCSQSVIQYV